MDMEVDKEKFVLVREREFLMLKENERLRKSLQKSQTAVRQLGR